MNPHIHYHSDCPFFAGCENMLAVFLNDDELNSNFNLSLSYRFSPTYDAGLKNRLSKKATLYPLKLLDVNHYATMISIRPLRIICRVFMSLFFIKYFFILWNTLILYRFFRKNHIDILHINNGGYPGAPSCMSAVFAAKLRGIRTIVYTVNNIATPYNSIERYIDKPLDYLVAKFVTIFVTGSVYAQEKLKLALHLPSVKSMSIHNGIEPRQVTETKIEVLERLHIKKNILLIGIVATLEKRKGHIYLLKALEKVLLNHSSVDTPLLLIEGTGACLPELKQFVNEHNLTNHVRFIGQEKNVFNLMNAVDMIVLPSVSHEDFPNIILEAMSLKKPIIASKLSGIPEQIIHRETGILVEPKNIDDLANSLIELMNNPELRLTLGANALKIFQEKFQKKVAIKTYHHFYNDLLTQRNHL